MARINRGLTAGLAGCRDLPGVADVRTIGAVGVVQLDHPVDVVKATDAAIEEGVWLRPFRDLVYTMPPYVTTDADVDRICTAIHRAVTVGMSAVGGVAGRAGRRAREAGLRRVLAPRAAADRVLDLAGNDYLGLSRDPVVTAAAADAALLWGAGAGASRLVTRHARAARAARGGARRLHRASRRRW